MTKEQFEKAVEITKGIKDVEERLKQIERFESRLQEFTNEETTSIGIKIAEEYCYTPCMPVRIVKLRDLIDGEKASCRITKAVLESEFEEL